MKEAASMEQIKSRDGNTIRFRRSGAGPPLLLVHGTTANHKRWLGIAPRLEQHFTVFAMDRRGRGGSSDDGEYILMREAEDVAAVVEAIGLPTFVLGHSYGGLCSLEAALLTEKMRKLILYEPPVPIGQPIYPPGVPERMQALIDQGDLEAALEVFFREVVRMPNHEMEPYRQLPMWKERVQLAPTIPRELQMEKNYQFQADKFANMRVPTLLLLGGDSPPPFSEATAQVDAALPDSRVVILPGQRHIAMDVAPDLFVREVEQFLLG
jgi:pimeloyl-ACP methyl ester carboxylesterase